MEEPSDFPTTVQLTLTRSGSFGAALITWAITPINTDLSDTGTNTGTVTFPSGSNTTQLEIFIFPDDEPEIDELFTVTLVAVTPSSQRISTELVCIAFPGVKWSILAHNLLDSIIIKHYSTAAPLEGAPCLCFLLSLQLLYSLELFYECTHTHTELCFGDYFKE